jgi:hypothetical protein
MRLAVLQVHTGFSQGLGVYVLHPQGVAEFGNPSKELKRLI